MNTLIPRLYLNQDGLAMLLGGDLQAAVFRAFQTPGTIRQALTRVCEDYGPVVYTTVATTANKLCEKGILYRTQVTPGTKSEYTYGAVFEEDALIDECIKVVIIKLRDEFPTTTSEMCYAYVNPKDLHTNV